MCILEIEFKVKTTEYELMKSTKFYFLALMTKYLSKTIDTMHLLLVIRFNYK